MWEENLVSTPLQFAESRDVNTGPVCIQMNVSSSDIHQRIIGDH
jgi:hypothetical protein